MTQPTPATPNADAAERQARIASLRERFNNVPAVSGGKKNTPMATADAQKIVGTIADVVGVEKSFYIRDLRDDDRAKLCAGFGITVDETVTAHQLSSSLASGFRRSKEIEVEHNKQRVVLMNQPGEGTRPSQWCVFKVT